jgi:DNA-binding beta-propeller fold protein YncE
VAWDAAGNIYISDGYINSRVAKYDKTGQFIKSFGERGGGPGQFHTPHGIGVDPQGNVYVADRGNRRIQVFDGDGKFLRQITIDVPYDTNAMPALGNKPDLTGTAPDPLSYGRNHYPGSAWTICITPGPNPVLYTSESYPGRIFKLSLEGKLLGVIGGRSGKQLKEFGWVHALACPSENEIYVAEILNWRVQKLILHPQQGRTTASTAGR